MGTKRNISDGPLGEYAEMGYQLRENGDHIVELFFKDVRVDTFSQVGATSEALQKACRKHWDRLIMEEAY